MGIPYPVANNLPDIDSLFDQKIDQLIKKDFGSADSLSQPKVGQLLVLFHKTSKIKKKSLWFGHIRDDLLQDTSVWELWRINVNCRPVPPEKLPADAALMHEKGVQLSRQSFEETLMTIYEKIDSKKDHIPLLQRLMFRLFPTRLKLTPNHPRSLLHLQTTSPGATTSKDARLALPFALFVNRIFNLHLQVGTIHAFLATNKDTLFLVNHFFEQA